MLCCCCRRRHHLDVTDDSNDTARAKLSDSEKEKAFSEAVTAHPSPAATPVTKQPDSKVTATGQPSPSQGANPTPVQQSPVVASTNPVGQLTENKPVVASSTNPVEHPPTVGGRLMENKPVEQARVVEESIVRSEAGSVDTTPTPTPTPQVSVINVTTTTPQAVGSQGPKDRAFLSQIEALSQAVEQGARSGALQGREACGVYATELSVLTAQVGKEASSMSESALQQAVARLETVASRLESLATKSGGGGSAGDGGETSPFVMAFDDIMSGAFAKFMSLSSTIGGDVLTQANMVKGAFEAERQFLVMASKSKAPAAANLGKVVQPVAEKLNAVQEFREKQRTSAMFNHLSAISESIAAVGWITVSPAPARYVQDMKDAGMFYTNRVLKDYKEKDGGQVHMSWVKAWLAILTELQQYIKDFHTTGVSWNPAGGDATAASAGAAPPPPPAGGPPPPPPPGPPPPPVAMAASDSDGGEDSRAALIASLNRGEAVTTGLRKVTDDMKTHKNPGLRQGPAPFKTTAPKPVAAPKPAAVAKPAPAKPPLTELQDKKWVVEYHNGNKSIVLEQTQLKQTVYVFKCIDSVIQVKGKVNSIILDSCKKTAVVFDDLVSSLEFVNCQSMQGQVTGKVPTISIDKTDGCMIYLSPSSLDTEIVTAKSSEMNILVPAGDGDYKEFALPEQFKTTWNGKSMVTVQTDSI